MIRQLSRSEFISSKLSMKLSQQIQDPLTICSNSSPSWTTHLVTSCKFLFPFELRRKFFFCKLDTPRALLFFNKEYEAAGERKDTLKVERGDTEVKLSLLKPNRVKYKLLFDGNKCCCLGESLSIQNFRLSNANHGNVCSQHTRNFRSPLL